MTEPMALEAKALPLAKVSTGNYPEAWFPWLSGDTPNLYATDEIRVSFANGVCSNSFIMADRHRDFWSQKGEWRPVAILVRVSDGDLIRRMEALTGYHVPPPSAGEGLEPVAWLGYWPGMGSVNSTTSTTHLRREADKWRKEGAEITPLYAVTPSARAAVLEEAATALKRLILAYVSLMETGYRRIIDLGGSCDPVEVMEAGDPSLIEARAALAALKEKT